MICSWDDTTHWGKRNVQHDLWIVGAGTLGEILCRQFREKYPDTKVIAETRTDNRHNKLSSYGGQTRLRYCHYSLSRTTFVGASQRVLD